MKKVITLLSIGLLVLMATSAAASPNTYDFRNSNWGDTLQEVIQAEGRYPDDDWADLYSYDIEGNPYFNEVRFHFNENNTLYSGSYYIHKDVSLEYSLAKKQFESSVDEFQKSANEERIDLIRERLTAKYGESHKGEFSDILKLTDSPSIFPPMQFWNGMDRYWVTEKTIICLYVDSESYPAPCIYYLTRTPQKAEDRAITVFIDALI
nr:hypothetical protein [uncultured Sphaerochaeta sp.]